MEPAEEPSTPNTNIQNIREMMHAIKSRFQMEKNEGKIPILSLLAVSIYNILVFELKEGFSIYIMLPLIVAGILFYLRYWETPVQVIRISGHYLVILMLVWDFFVSASYIPHNRGLEDYRYESVPTLIIDIFGIYFALTMNIRESADDKQIVGKDHKELV